MFEWREVPGYPSYSVSSEGIVARTTRAKTARVKNMNPTTNKDGCKYLTLMNGGKGKTFRVHRLVLLAFIGESDLHADHINGERDDNRIENLRYISPSDHAKLHYGRNTGKPEVAASLTEEQVVSLREEYAAGVSSKILMGKYQLCAAAVCELARGITYRNVGGPRTIRGKGWKEDRRAIL